MLINDVKNREEIHTLVTSELRLLGIKYRKDKKNKNGQDKTIKRKIFHTPLHLLELTDVILTNGGVAQIPRFVFDACQRILEQVQTEGLFRKAGSNIRQKEIKASLELGTPLGKTHHVIDVANVLKSFFRDLPEPLLPPGNLQETLLRSLLCGDKQIHTLLLTCLLLPPLSLNTLAFFMQFLQTISHHSTSNKMTIENLAIIFTPGLMPLAEIIGQRLNNHVKILKMLMENADKIGVLPDSLVEKAELQLGPLKSLVGTDKKKKKRRSGSLTRMFNGIRKIVGAIGSTESLDKTMEMSHMSTPCLTKSSKKRKGGENTGFSAKKKKEVLSLLPDSGDLLPCTPHTKKSKKSRLSLGGRSDGKSLMGLVIKKTDTSSVPMERRWSVVGSSWSRKKQSDRQREELIPLKNLSPVISMPCLVPNDSFSEDFLIRAPKLLDTDSNDTMIEGEIVDKDFMKISKSEYEAIKERVSAIESRISQEFGNVQSSLMTNDSSLEMDTGLENVQDKYKKTLEETGSMSNFTSTDQLAKRLSRDLKIRRSAEHKIIRSPSARKIGTMRRRSKENATRLSRNQSWHVPVTRTTSIILPTQNIEQSSNDGTDVSFYPKANLRRGRPNTVKMGLRHPSPAKKISESDKDEEWTSGSEFFTKPENNVYNMSFDDNFEMPKIATPTSSRKLSLRSAVTPPNFVSKMNLGEMKTPMLPPNLPPRRTPLTITKTPMLPPRSHGKIINKALLTPLQDQQTGRASIARIRSQNAGMVAAKAKLFDGMADGSSEERKTQKNRKSVVRNSPKKTTPKRKNFKQSPNYIQRRQKVRLAKSPLALDNMIKHRQILTEISPFKENSKDEEFCTPTKDVFRKISKNNENGLEVMTPPIKRALLIKSPKRIINRERSQKTPMKVPRGSTEGEFSQLSLRSSPRFLHSSRPY